MKNGFNLQYKQQNPGLYYVYPYTSADYLKVVNSVRTAKICLKVLKLLSARFSQEMYAIGAY